MSTFISYSTQDTDKAKQIVKALEDSGIKCFYAPRDIEPGTDYATEIIKAIKNMDCVTLVFSSASNASMYVLREVNSAVLHNKLVIPFKVDNTAPSESMEFYLGATHWLDASPVVFDSAIDLLAKAISRITPVEEKKEQTYFEKPTMLDAAEAARYGYDIQRIAMETIQLDYIALAGNKYLINDEIEGTVQDWIDLFINYPDMYSMLFYQNQMVGYWLMEMINDENYETILDGKQIINAQQQEFYELGGDFNCYVAIMPLIKQYENATNYLMLFSSLFSRIVSFAEKGVQVNRFGISVYSALQEQILKRLGFAYKGDNPAKGKIYELTADSIRGNETIRKNYPEFYALYAN